MPKKTLALLAITMIMVALAVQAILSRPQLGSKAMDFQVEIRPGELAGILDLAADNYNYTIERRDLEDGTAEFRAMKAGKVTETVVLYAGAGKTYAQRQVKSRVRFNDDGSLFSEDRFSETGVRTEIGRQWLNGLYAKTDLQADGNSTRQFDLTRGASILFEVKYRDDNNMEWLMARQSDGTTTTTYYSSTEKIEKVRLVDHDNRLTDVLYWADGRTVKARFAQRPLNVVCDYYRPDGSHEQSRNYKYDGTFTATMYNSSGDPLYSQDWEIIGNLGTDGKLTQKLELSYVSEIATQRVIYFQDDGKTPKRVQEPADKTSGYFTINKTFRKDGTLSSIDYLDDSGHNVTTDSYPPQAAIREVFPPEYAIDAPHEDPTVPMPLYAPSGRANE